MVGPPLDGVRVVDLTVERGELCGRLLGDLGADVVKVEPPAGSPARSLPPTHRQLGLFWAVRNAGKRTLELDLPEEQATLDQLLAVSDIALVSAGRDESPVDPAQLHRFHPHLVVVAISPYGLTGPWAERLATDGVLAATGTIAWKAGRRDADPILPPGSFVDDSTSVMFAFAALCALWQRDQQGFGQLLDCSQNEGIANLSDWALPNSWVRHAAQQSYRDVRAGSGPLWPVLRCADGFVTIVILSALQWHAMRAWLGEPDYLQDPELDSLPAGAGIADAVINPLIEELFAERTMAELTVEAQRRGIVCTPVATPADVLRTEHFLERASFVELELGEGIAAPVPSGFLEIDGQRMGPTVGPPLPGEHNAAILREPSDMSQRRRVPEAAPEPALPLRGLRVADFGHGGVGVEIGLALAELGADVIKMESRAYPDFIRIATGTEMSPSFVSASRSKRGFGANAKNADGRRVIRRLIDSCDVVIENNSTGVMAGLHLDYETLRETNPGLVMVSSQLMGSRGPWADFRGYGPSTRAAGGLEMLWKYRDEQRPAGSSSIFPDQLCGRVGALGALAALLRRRTTGVGAHVEVAQVETTIGIVAEHLPKEALDPGSVRALGSRSERGVPWGLFRCAGDERWVAITCRSDADWAGLVEAMERPLWALAPEFATADGRAVRIDEVEAGVRAWTASLFPDDIARRCQECGVPAGEMLTPLEILENEHYRARGFAVEIVQPGLASETVMLDAPGFLGSLMSAPVITPAPWVGEHTRDICIRELGLPAGDVDALIAAGALEVTPVPRQVTRVAPPDNSGPVSADMGTRGR